MRKLYTAVVLTLTILFILALIAGAVIYAIYNLYLKPTPAVFEFSGEVDSQTSIEVIRLTKLSDTELEIIPIAKITDTDQFFRDFSELDCTVGVSVHALSAFANLESIDGIRVTYSDGSFEVITAYGNIKSSLHAPEITLKALLTEKYYFFDSLEFDNLIAKYSAK